ncbi:hypothetical protein GCM10009678_04250 [Actinomadura kijaniata]
MDPKTAERWVSTGRTPHRTTAYKAARALREDMAYLWPSLEQGRRRRGLHPELIALHDTRADAPFDLWRTLFTKAHERIEILAYAAVFLHEQWPDFNDLLQVKAAAGCRVRVLLGDADAAAVSERGEEEKLRPRHREPMPGGPDALCPADRNAGDRGAPPRDDALQLDLSRR